eukprot:jgi/Chlat1/6935/Chrsp52S06612
MAVVRGKRKEAAQEVAPASVEQVEAGSSDDEGELSWNSEVSSDDEDGLQVSESGEEDGEEQEREDEDEGDAEDEEQKDIRQAVQAYYGAAAEHAGSGDEDEGYARDDVENAAERRASGDSAGAPPALAQDSDSSEDERPSRNTIGKVPLEWYKAETHIGYDRAGQKLLKKERKDQLASFLAKTDDKKAWRTVYDEYNDEDIVLNAEEVQMIQRIREGKFPHAEINPYEPYVDWFEYEDGIHPLSNAPEPKRRFIPSKWEAKQVVKLVRAMRKGWIKLHEKPKEKPMVYLLWEDDYGMLEKTQSGLTYIPAPKATLPGHEESYNPPEEYLPTEEEASAYKMADPIDRPAFIPQRFMSLRAVPMYENFIKERFERCLDLYLAPRARRKKLNIDPESLIPKLPKPRDLQPFPTMVGLVYIGHTGRVGSISVDPSGQWLASGSDDATVRVWEVRTGRCFQTWTLNAAVRHIAWNPNPSSTIIAVATGKAVVLLNAATGAEGVHQATETLLKLKEQDTGEGNQTLCSWSRHSAGGVELQHAHPVHQVTWHHKGDYFATAAPEANTTAVLVHQLSKQQTQNPFRKNKGRVVQVSFHPSKPFFYVATQSHVRVYNLAKQELAKKLITGVQSVSSLAIHPGGDNLIIGSQDRKLCWFDLDLSSAPYKNLRYHDGAIQSVAFHPRYPLFASCADDATIHVFHGMVYADLLQNALLVPLKILRGHDVVKGSGVLDCVFHPQQPWLFSAGADGTVRLYCN